MNDNIYAAPEAKLEIKDPITSGRQFYVVSDKKFLVLYISTLGVYSVYWFFKNWQLHKESSGEDIWPVPRAIFSIFFVHALFRRVAYRLEEAQRELTWKHGDLATFLVVSMLIERVCDRLSMKEIGTPYTDIISLAIMFLMAPLFLRAQKMINLSCDDALGESNSQFTTANYVWIAVGVFFWLMYVVGMFIE